MKQLVPFTSNGWLTAALVTAGLLGVAHVAYKADVVRFLYGKGYVPWVKLEWKAKQAATKLKRPLVVYYVDPRHPDNDRLEKLLRAPELQSMIDMFVWHKVEAPGQGAEAAPPLITCRGSNGEAEIIDSFVMDESITPAALADKLCAALSVHGYEPGS